MNITDMIVKRNCFCAFLRVSAGLLILKKTELKNLYPQEANEIIAMGILMDRMILYALQATAFIPEELVPPPLPAACTFTWKQQKNSKATHMTCIKRRQFSSRRMILCGDN